MSKWNQPDLDAALRCLTLSHPPTWWGHLPCVQYRRQSLTLATTSCTLFIHSLRFLYHFFHLNSSVWTGWRLFPESDFNTAGRFVRHLIVLYEGHSTYCSSPLNSQTIILTRSKAFFFKPPLRAEFQRFSARFSGPFVIKCINPSAGRLKLPDSMWVGHTFHVAQPKPKSSWLQVLLSSKFPQVTVAFCLANKCQLI